MFRAIAILSLITATFVFSGCPKKKADKPADKPAAAKKAEPKKAEPKKDEAKKDEAKKDEAKKDEAKKAGSTIPENLKGVADCEAYFKAYNCYIGKLPAAGQEAAKKGMAMAMGAWAKIPKASLGASCKAGLDALKKGASNPAVKKYWDGCFPK